MEGAALVAVARALEAQLAEVLRRLRHHVAIEAEDHAARRLAADADVEVDLATK